jgi:hypothetical protein
MDNLNTRGIASLYETFEPEEAGGLAERLDIHDTPKHGSWLNMAEIERSVLKGQCLDRRIPDMATMQTQVAAWERDRNSSGRKLSGKLRHRTLGSNGSVSIRSYGCCLVLDPDGRAMFQEDSARGLPSISSAGQAWLRSISSTGWGVR